MTLTTIRLITLGAAVSFTPLAVIAQTDTPATPTTQNQDASGSMGSQGAAMKDKTFVRKAAAGGLAEVQLGQLAVQKSSSDDVKKFAQKMVDDHTQLNEQIKPFADSLGVSVPTHLTKKDQAEYDKLNGMSGSDFDKEYLSYMVKDHAEDLREFRQEERTTTNPDLKQTVAQGTKVIAQHKRMVDKLASANGVSVS